MTGLIKDTELDLGDPEVLELIHTRADLVIAEWYPEGLKCCNCGTLHDPACVPFRIKQEAFYRALAEIESEETKGIPLLLN